MKQITLSLKIVVFCINIFILLEFIILSSNNTIKSLIALGISGIIGIIIFTMFYYKTKEVNRDFFILILRLILFAINIFILLDFIFATENNNPTRPLIGMIISTILAPSLFILFLNNKN